MLLGQSHLLSSNSRLEVDSDNFSVGLRAQLVLKAKPIRQ